MRRNDDREEEGESEFIESLGGSFWKEKGPFSFPEGKEGRGEEGLFFVLLDKTGKKVSTTDKQQKLSFLLPPTGLKAASSFPNEVGQEGAFRTKVMAFLQPPFHKRTHK